MLEECFFTGLQEVRVFLANSGLKFLSYEYLSFVKICDYSKESELFSVFIFDVAVEFENKNPQASSPLSL